MNTQDYLLGMHMAKDAASKEFGYADFDEAKGECYTGFSKSHVMVKIMHRAMIIWANQKVEDVLEYASLDEDSNKQAKFKHIYAEREK